jgi:F0F1-type ATP synthase assembly protein I
MRRDAEEQAVPAGPGKLRSVIARQVAVANLQANGPQSDVYRNFSDGFTRAVELAVTPVIFGGLGHLVDRWLGTGPLFLALFFLVAVVGMLLRTWYGYAYRMAAMERSAPWSSAATEEVHQ